MHLSSKNILAMFTVDAYYDPIWDRVYENKANDDVEVIDLSWLYAGIQKKLD